MAADALDKLDSDVECDGGSNDDGLTHFNAVYASENVNAICTEYCQHAHVHIIQGACTGKGVSTDYTASCILH